MRGQLFAALLNAAKPVSAYDLAEQLSVMCHPRVAANSVYRMLDLFMSASLATKVASVNAYIISPHPGSTRECFLLVCDICGRTVHVDEQNIAESIRQLAQRSEFYSDHAIIEVRGSCKRCL